MARKDFCSYCGGVAGPGSRMAEQGLMCPTCQHGVKWLQEHREPASRMMETCMVQTRKDASNDQENS